MSTTFVCNAREVHYKVKWCVVSIGISLKCNYHNATGSVEALLVHPNFIIIAFSRLIVPSLFGDEVYF